MSEKYVKVMFGTSSLAGDGFQYKIGTVNTAILWNPDATTPKGMGGFNFSTEEKIFRFLVRGDTLYEVELPIDSEIIAVESSSAPNGVFRSNKIILKNPHLVTDEVAMELYKKSKLPEKSYFKALAGCAVRGYLKTAKKVIADKVNSTNIDLAIEELLDFTRPDDSHSSSGECSCVAEVLNILLQIKNTNI